MLLLVAASCLFIAFHVLPRVVGVRDKVASEIGEGGLQESLCYSVACAPGDDDLWLEGGASHYIMAST